MKYQYPFFAVLFICCFGIYGLWNSEQLQQKETLQSSQTAVSNLQDSIQALQNSVASLQDSVKNILAKNPDLDVQMQLNNMREKLDTYQKLVSDTTSNMHDDISDFYSKMIGILSLIGLVLGVAAPLYFNYRNEKNMENLLEGAKSEAANAKMQAKDAGDALVDIQKKVSEATDKATASSAQAENARTALVNFQKNAEKIAKDAEGAAKKAKATQYFIQALQENDPDRAIGYYDNCIDLDPDFAEAYNKRGYLRYRKGEIDDAKKDFENAIAKKEKFAEAYNNLGVLLFSQKNFDDANENYDDAEDNFNRAGEYAEAILNLGLLNYAKRYLRSTEKLFDKALNLKPNFAEAFYIRGLYYLKNPWFIEQGIEDIIKAKYYMPNVIEAYPNQNLLTGKMKEWNNYFIRVEYSRDFKTLIRVPKDKQGIFKIPDSVTEIGLGAFWGCTGLTSIEIPDSVTVIGGSAFWGCTNLTSIKIPDSVTAIWNSAFWGCTSLTSIEIPNSVTVIGMCAFDHCTSLTSIEIPDSVTVIGDYAFSDCTNLTEIHLKHTSPVDFSKAFKDLDRSKITLYVPKGSLQIYKDNGYYRKFKIEEEKS